MKIRNSYVSNSSSASFIVYNWFDLDKNKQDIIKNYPNYAFDVWLKNNIPFRNDKGQYYFTESDVYDIAYKNDLPQKDKDELYNKYIVFAFGFIFNEIGYECKEFKKRNTCTLTTPMTNFNMEKWLEYNNIDFDKLY